MRARFLSTPQVCILKWGTGWLMEVLSALCAGPDGSRVWEGVESLQACRGRGFVIRGVHW